MYKFAKITNVIQAYLDLLLKREKPQAYPVELSLGTTSFCNLKCVHCPREGNEDNLTPFDEHLDMEYYQTLKPYLKHSKQVSLYGLGEPMIDRGYFEKVRLVTSHGAVVSLSSNGTLLDERRCRETIDSGIQAIGISLDAACEETFSVVRPPGGFDKIVENIKRLVRMKKEMGVNHPQLMLSFGIMHQNVNDVPAFVDIAADIECDELVMHPIIYMSSQAKRDYAPNREIMLEKVEQAKQKANELGIPFHFWDLDPMTYLNSLEYVRRSNGNENGKRAEDDNGSQSGVGKETATSKTKQQPHYCHFLWRNAMIQGKGELFPCCYLTNIKVGQIENGNLRELRGHSTLADLRNRIMEGDAPKPCQSCPQMQPYNRWTILKTGIKEIRAMLKS